MGGHVIKSMPDRTPAPCDPSKLVLECVSCGRRTAPRAESGKEDRSVIVIDASTLFNRGRWEQCPMYRS